MGYRSKQKIVKRGNSKCLRNTKYLTSSVTREMQIKTTSRFHFPPVRMAKIIKQVTARDGKIWSKETTHSLLVAMWTPTATMEISVVVPQEVGNQFISRFSISLLGINPKDASTYHRDTCLTMVIATLHNSQKLETTRISLHRTIDKEMGYIYKMEYYWAVKTDFMKFTDK